MGRLIDADKFEAFVIRTNGDEEFVNGVQYVLEKIDNAPTVEAIPKDNVYKAIQEMMEYEHERTINISLARLNEILEKNEVWGV